MTVLFVKVQTKDRQVVARVNDQNIIRSEVLDKIIHENWDATVSTIAEEIVLRNEAAGLKFEPSEADIQKEVSILEETQHKNINLNNSEELDKVKMRIITKKLAQKYIVNDDSIHEFLSERNGDIGNRKFHVITLESSDHNLLSQIAQEAAQHPSAELLEKNYKVKFKSEVLGTDNNPFKLNLEELQVGSVEHIQNSKTNHTIIIVTGIDNILIDDTNFEQNKDRILNVFLNNQYFKLKTDLINYLFDKNSVNIHQL
jgi:hypothetical protein